MARAIDASHFGEIMEQWKKDCLECDDQHGADVIADVILQLDDMPTLTQPNEPLTLEQLRQMDGEPVWVKCLNSKKYTDPPIGWRIVERSITGTIGVWNGESCFAERDYGVDWLAYAYPPARIDREAWEPCEFCGKADFGEYGFEIGRSYFKIACALGSWRFQTEEQFHFCPKCGRPLTEKARAEKAERERDAAISDLTYSVPTEKGENEQT